jgi:amino acid efflux transporter
MFFSSGDSYGQIIARNRHQHGTSATICPRFGAIMRGMRNARLGVTSGTALYVGAVLGPGVLILPALAAQAAGPASVLAWAGLLGVSVAVAVTFAALGVRHPVAGGAAAYVEAAFGRLPATMTAWWFLAGVVIGAPTVSLVGGFYVAHLVGGGRPVAIIAAATMLAAALGANAGGVRLSAAVQLALAALLAALLLTAIVAALPAARASHWTPFAPHGWLAVGTAANLLMLSFVGWEAVAHLAGEFTDPLRQLPRAIVAAFAVVAVLYLGLAVATIAVLGAAASSNVPLADLMEAGFGRPGRIATAAAAVLLTLGPMNVYIAGATKLAGAMAAERSMPPWLARPRAPLATIAAVAATILALLTVGLVDVEPLVRACSTCFVAVYVPATAAGARLLTGRLRAVAALAFALVLVVLAFSGAYLAVPGALAVAALTRAGGAAWRGSSAGPGCRTASRA